MADDAGPKRAVRCIPLEQVMQDAKGCDWATHAVVVMDQGDWTPRGVVVFGSRLACLGVLRMGVTLVEGERVERLVAVDDEGVGLDLIDLRSGRFCSYAL